MRQRWADEVLVVEDRHVLKGIIELHDETILHELGL